MIYPGVLKGTFVSLRAVIPADAEFILDLRQREEVCKFMHKVDISVEEQIEWIKTHQKIDGDYYFLICNKDNEPIGTISLYDKQGDHCEIGRAASIGNSIENIDAIILTYDFAFEKLGYKFLVGSISPENLQVKELNRNFGFKFKEEIVCINGMQLQLGKVTREDYYAKRSQILELLYKASKVLI